MDAHLGNRPEPPEHEAFRDAEAAFRRQPSSASRADLVAAAVALLVAGVDSPNLVALAGEDTADLDEVAAYLDATLQDLGLRPLDQTSIARRTIDHVSQQILDGRIPPRDGAAAIWDAFYPAASALAPDIGRLATIADYLDHGWETWGPSTADFLEALRMYLAGERVREWDLVTNAFRP